MAQDPKELRDEINRGLKAALELDEENTKAFINLNDTALKPGALDTKTKWIICAAIALASNSQHCNAGRVRGALEAGASRQELIEAAALGRLMGGSLVLGNSITLFFDSIKAFAPDYGK
jgi:alkylhydroperoxidase/carboxymuconolactone decarboxylase family protein YurZ